jgi:hypothetical protein
MEQQRDRYSTVDLSMPPFQYYLWVLEHLNIEPNFWCSIDFWNAANWQLDYCYDKSIMSKDGIKRQKRLGMKENEIRLVTTFEQSIGVIITDNEGQPMLPPIFSSSRFKNEYKKAVGWDHKLGFEYGMPNMKSYSQVDKEWEKRLKFVDYQYIYDPKQFLDLSGGQYKTTRKNIRACRQDMGEGIILEPYHEKQKEYLDEIISKWVESVKDKEWYDPETFLNCIFQLPKYWVLGMDTDKIYGVVVYDENYRYVNFRACLVNPEYRGLSEYVRILFFREMANQEKLINDGGDLGNEGLRFFKKRLCPVRVSEIYSVMEKNNGC